MMLAVCDLQLVLQESGPAAVESADAAMRRGETMMHAGCDVQVVLQA